MKNICYIISGIDKALAFEWIHQELDQQLFKLHFVLLHHRKGPLEEYLDRHGVPFLRVHYASKKNSINAVWETYHYLKKNKIDLVHCHLLDAGLVGILAAKIAGLKQRIYSRHYSTYHHVYHPKGIWYDRTINRLSTRIVAVSDVVKKILVEREGVKQEKIEVIHHGFPLGSFQNPDTEKLAAMKEKYHFSGKWPVVGVISRFTEWKGIQYTIPAFSALKEKYPKAHLILANAKGDYAPAVLDLLSTLPVDSFTTIEFENDLFSLFHCFDIFVHVPVDEHSEAFGQVYVEALAAGIPSVFTLSGIGKEIIRDQENALSVPYRDSKSILEKMMYLCDHKTVREYLSKNGPRSVGTNFALVNMMRKLTALYE